MKRRMAIVAAMVLMMSGCASMRKIEVGSGGDVASRLTVANSHSSSVVVSYTDTRGTHELGTVSGGSSQSFTIPGNTGSTVTISGVTSGGSRYQKTATLGSTSKVTL